MKKIILILITLFLTACQQAPQDQLIVYVENEDGVEAYKTRIIVTSKYMRFDEGDDSNTFLLFDRAKKVAYSVNHEMKSTMVVHGKTTIVEPPVELKHSVKIVDDVSDAPKIEGVTPVHRQHSTNDKVCFDVISVEGVMPAAVEAMKEFHLVLATDSAATFSIIPADMLDPCAISMSTFAPTRQLQHGFPVREWKAGYVRNLVDYKNNYKVDAALLILPKDYFTYTVQQFREGRVDMLKQKVFSDEDLEAMNKSSVVTGSEAAPHANADSADADGGVNASDVDGASKDKMPEASQR